MWEWSLVVLITALNVCALLYYIRCRVVAKIAQLEKDRQLCEELQKDGTFEEATFTIGDVTIFQTLSKAFEASPRFQAGAICFVVEPQAFYKFCESETESGHKNLTLVNISLEEAVHGS